MAFRGHRGQDARTGISRRSHNSGKPVEVQMIRFNSLGLGVVACTFLVACGNQPSKYRAKFPCLDALGAAGVGRCVGHAWSAVDGSARLRIPVSSTSHQLRPSTAASARKLTSTFTGRLPTSRSSYSGRQKLVDQPAPMVSASVRRVNLPGSTGTELHHVSFPRRRTARDTADICRGGRVGPYRFWCGDDPGRNGVRCDVSAGR